MARVTMETCARCSAFWVHGSPTCRFCGHDPATDPVAPTTTTTTTGGPPGPRPGRRGDVGIIVATVVTLLVMATGGVVLLGGSGDRAPATTPAPGSGGERPTTTTEPRPAHALASVCDGDGHPDAAAYDPDHGGTRAFRLVREGDRWRPHSDDQPWEETDQGRRRVIGDDFPLDPTIDLVLCVTRTDVVAATLDCDYETDRGGRMVVETRHHTAQVVVREARTSNVVHEAEILGTVGCPATVAVPRGESSVALSPSGSEIAEVAEPFLAGG